MGIASQFRRRWPAPGHPPPPLILIAILAAPGIVGFADTSAIDAAQTSSPGRAHTVRALIDGERHPLWGTLTSGDRRQLTTLYAPADAPIWADATGRRTADARAALTLLEDVHAEGLEPADSGQTDAAAIVAATAENIARLRRGQLRVRQRPGPKNSLGLVKFVFPNDANVYLHGTPARELFSRTRRDFSHGCVRVEDTVALAEWALQDQPGWTRDRILAAMNADTPRRVHLTQPITVILFYITAVVMPEDDSVHFAEDIYRHDARLDRALVSGGSSP